MHALSRVIFIVLALFVSQAAVAEEWIVARVTGTAWLLREGAAPVQVAAGIAVPLGATIATMPQGRAMLVHGRDTMMVGPSTKIAIPYKPDRGMKATVIQQFGTIDLAVEKRRRPHFSVQTPFLAAVVKGTEFTVNVSSVAAEVGVKRGLVSVADFATGQRADVGAGQHAAASPGQKLGLQVAGLVAPKVHAGRPQKASIPAEPQAAAPGQSGPAHAANGVGPGSSPGRNSSAGPNGNGGASSNPGSNASSSGNGNPGGGNAGTGGNGPDGNGSSGGDNNGNGGGDNGNSGGGGGSDNGNNGGGDGGNGGGGDNGNGGGGDNGNGGGGDNGNGGVGGDGGGGGDNGNGGGGGDNGNGGGGGGNGNGGGGGDNGNGGGGDNGNGGGDNGNSGGGGNGNGGGKK